MDKKTILFKAPLLTMSGYGVHSRQVAKTLIDLYPEQVKFLPTNWGMTGWILDSHEDKELISDINNRLITEPDKKFDLSLQLLLPDEWKTELAEKNIGITAGVETDKCSKIWIDFCNKMDEVIVPSAFTKKTFLNSGKLEKEITVVNEETYIDQEYYDNNINLENTFEIENNIRTKFNFVVFGQLTGNNPENDRKNLFNTLKYICETFPDDKDVGIILKTNIGRNTTIDRENALKIFNNIIKEIRKTEYPKIYLIHGDMSKQDIFQLYTAKNTKAIVSLSRGEGFCIPLLEAASCDLPVIATNWSGQLDFLNKGKFLKVDYELKEIHPSRVDNRIFYKDFKWAEISKDHFIKRLLTFKESPNIPKEWAKQLGVVLRKDFSSNSIKQQYKNILEKYI